MEVEVAKVTKDTFKLDEENIEFTEAVAPEGKVTLTWTGDFKKDDIVTVQPNCGCTAEVEWEDGKITAVYTADTLEKIKRKTTDLERQFPSGKVPTQKSLVVYLNDGEDMKAFNDKGFEVNNPNKEKVLIHFHGYIKFK